MAFSQLPAGGKMECDFPPAFSHEPAGGNIECDFSQALSQLPAGGKIVCEFVFTFSIEGGLIYIVFENCCKNNSIYSDIQYICQIFENIIENSSKITNLMLIFAFFDRKFAISLYSIIH